MPPGTFSRSGMSVSLEESPPLPRKRQRLAEGGEDVNRLYQRAGIKGGSSHSGLFVSGVDITNLGEMTALETKVSFFWLG